jgi:hypothetical protein
VRFSINAFLVHCIAPSVYWICSTAGPSVMFSPFFANNLDVEGMIASMIEQGSGVSHGKFMSSLARTYVTCGVPVQASAAV